MTDHLSLTAPTSPTVPDHCTRRRWLMATVWPAVTVIEPAIVTAVNLSTTAMAPTVVASGLQRLR